MSSLIRFGVSLEQDLLDKFDKLRRNENYSNRSEAIRDLIREKMVRKEWVTGKEVVGVITLVYDHHKRELMNRLADIQHDAYRSIISTQHIHMDHDNCLEIIVVKGSGRGINKLAHTIRTEKGVKYCTISAATTGKDLS